MRNKKMQIAEIVLLIWLLLIGVISVLMGAKYASDAFIIACLVILFSILCVLKDGFMFERNVSFFSVVLAMVFVLQTSISQVFELFFFENIISGWSFKVVFSLTFLVASYIIINWGLKKIVLHDDVVKTKNKGKLCVLYAVIPIIVVTICFLIYSYPGYSYPDMLTCWNWAVSETWNEWHTIGYLLYLRFFYILFKHSFSVSIGQAIFWVFLQYKAIRLIYIVTRNKKAVALYSLISCVVFTPMLYCGMLVKDAIYCQCLFALFLCMVEFVSLSKVKKTTVILTIISAIGVSIFRHAGVFSVLLTLSIMIVYCFWTKKKILQSAFAVILIIVMVSSAFVNNILPRKYLEATTNPRYITYTVPMYQIGAVCNARDHIEQEDIEIIEQIMPLEKWKFISSQNRYWADNICREYGAIGSDVLKVNDSNICRQILMLNVKWIIKYPKEYLTAFFDISSIIWEIGRPSDGYEWAPLEGGAIDSETGNSTIEQTFIRQGLENIAEMTLHTPILRSVFWRGGFWIFIIVFSAVIMLLKNQSKYLISFVLPFITVALLFLSIPAQDPRYILFLMEIGLFALVLSIFIKTRNKIGETEV